MRRINLTDPNESETPEHICWHNLEIADECHILPLFISASRSWLDLYPDKNYQHLEKELRDRNMQTHLIATYSKSIPNTKLTLSRKDDPTDYQYECIFSCRPKEFALKELLEHWKSYEENFEKLALAGSLQAENTEEIPDEDFIKFNDREISDYEKIIKNLKKITATEITAREYIDEFIKTHKEKHGRDLEAKIIAMNPTGLPIFGFFADNELVSHIGYSFRVNLNDDRVEMALVDLRNL